jgi:hypothetical protein
VESAGFWDGASAQVLPMLVGRNVVTEPSAVTSRVTPAVQPAPFTW